MKYVSIILTLLLVTGCATIHHKSAASRPGFEVDQFLGINMEY